MKIFILTVSINDVVEEIDAFDTFEDAQLRADEIALEFNIARQQAEHTSKMNGWILYDVKPHASNDYSPVFITAVVRDIKHKAAPKTDVSYDSIIDKLKDLVTAPVVTVPAITLDQQPKDDFFDLKLPGGFSLKDKAILMSDVAASPYDVKSIYDLSKVQKWALTTSRIKKRPAFMCLVPAHGVFSQRYALEELEKRSPAGEELVRLEMVQLEAVYQNAMNQQSDEESSSSEEDGGSYNYHSPKRIPLPLGRG